MASDAGQGTETLARLVGALFAVIGLGLLFAAVLVGRSTLHFVRTAARAAGVVTQMNTAGGSHPEIQFTAANGQVVSYPQGGMIGGFRVGDRVTVLYDPSQPIQTASINAPGALWDGMGSLLFFGIVFSGLGLARALGSKTVFVRGLEK